MEKLSIHANIANNKAQEFKQSMSVFFETLKQADGYLGYTENPGELYCIIIEWESRQQLDSFLESELYQFLHGAMITLGQITEITIKSQKK